MVFFKAWQLWEQLTFVLATALVAVFCAGCIKLWWINRKVRKHEIGDEEKRMRLEEIRQSGATVSEDPIEDPIPFGVRALEKNIRVDGIWFSEDAAPIPEHLRIGKYVKRKSTASDMSKGSGNKQDKPPRASPAPSFQERVMNAFGYPSHTTTENAQDMQFGDGVTEPPARRAYQPKRSSHLRYSYNDVDYDAETLGKLEGSIPIKDDVQVRRPRGAGPTPGTANNVYLTDTERASGSFESTDGTIGVNNSADTLRTLKYPATYLPVGHQQGDYDAAPAPRTPVGPPDHNPFATPDQTPSNSDTSSKHATPSTYRTAVEATAVESQLPLLESHSREASPERRDTTPEPSFAFTNQATRHVNSGFSVLPAGTFASAAQSKGKEVERPTTGDSQISQASEESHTTQASKKKNRFSFKKQATKLVNSGVSDLPNATSAAASGSKGKEVDRPTTGDSEASQASEGSQTTQALKKKNRFSLTNQDTRHVNSGFSVFSAGTSAVTSDHKGKDVERPITKGFEASQASEASPDSQVSPKKNRNKLRKKGRFSFTGPRRSDDLR